MKTQKINGVQRATIQGYLHINGGIPLNSGALRETSRSKGVQVSLADSLWMSLCP